MTRRLLGFAVAGLLIVACSDARDADVVDSGAAGGAGAEAPEAGTGGAGASAVDAQPPEDTGASDPPECTLAVSSCKTERAIELWNPLLEASEFGAGARFLAVGGAAVLVGDAAGAQRAVRLYDRIEQDTMPAGSPRYALWTFPSAAPQATHVTEGAVSGQSGRSVFALACDASGRGCSVLRGDPGQNELGEWAGSELPAAFTARGIAFDRAAARPGPCVYGSGMLCFESRWQEVIAAGDGAQINAVAFSRPWSVAVGDHGRVFRRVYDPAAPENRWAELEALADVALTGVSVARLGAVILGDGRVQAALGEHAQAYGCGTPASLLALMINEVTLTAFAVARDGEILGHGDLAAPGAWCSFSRLEGVEPLDVAAVRCIDSIEPRVLTSDAILGTNFCARCF